MMCCREIFSASVREMSEPILFSLDITSVMLSPRWGHALCFCIVRLCVYAWAEAFFGLSSTSSQYLAIAQYRPAKSGWSQSQTCIVA